MTISLLAVVLTAILSILDSTGTIITQDRERALAIPELERGPLPHDRGSEAGLRGRRPASPTTESKYMDVRVRRTTSGSTSNPTYATFFAPWSYLNPTNVAYIVGAVVANRVVASNQLIFKASGLSGLGNGVSAYFQSSWRECRRSPSITDPGSNC